MTNGCNCPVCQMVREYQEKHYGHYLCKYANALTGDRQIIIQGSTGEILDD